jgi:hypothetical protein
MKLDIIDVYKYSKSYYRVNFNDGCGFLYTKEELKKWKLIIKHLDKNKRVG